MSGSSGRVDYGQASFPHAAMPFADTLNGGACVLEIESNRLDLKWICADGKIRDHFTMMKNVNKRTTVHLKKGESATLTASFVGEYEWNNKQNSRSIKVSPPGGTSKFTVRDKYHCIEDTFEIIVGK